MKKIISLFMLFVLCFVLVGCDDSGVIPYNYNSAEVRQKIDELGDNEGYLIEYTMIYNDDMRMIDDHDDYDDDFGPMIITIGYKNSITYFSMGFVEVYIDYSDYNKIVLYAGLQNDSTSTKEWKKQELSYSDYYSSDIYDSYLEIYDFLIPSRAFNEGDVIKKKLDVVALRTCDKLTIQDRNYGGLMDVYIDKELGICLKMVKNEQSKEGIYSESGMECTRFETNPVIILPNI